MTGSFSYTNRKLTTENNTGLSAAGVFVVCLLVISFAYELPLANITPYDRLNPRLFDVAAGLLFLYWLFVGRVKGWRPRLFYPIVFPWFWLMFFFTIATVASPLWIPLKKYYFSIFYLLKYFEVFVVVVIFASIPFTEKDKRKILWVALFGGVWVSFYAVLQYVGLVSIKRYLPTGQEIVQFEQGLYSTLGVTYFHLGMFGVISCLIGMSVYSTSKGFWRFVALLCTLFCFLPSVISGSKAGLIGIAMAMFFMLFQKQYRKNFSTYVAVAFVVLIGLVFIGQSVALERLETGSGGTPVERIKHGFNTLSEVYDYHGPRLLAFGGGFYVVPTKSAGRNGEPNYRVGYGNHNIFLFPLEQAGVGAFVTGLLLWFSVSRNLRRIGKLAPAESTDATLANSMHVFFLVVMVVGIAGQVFYLGFGTEHFTVYQLVMYLLATTMLRFPELQSIQERADTGEKKIRH